MGGDYAERDTKIELFRWMFKSREDFNLVEIISWGACFIGE